MSRQRQEVEERYICRDCGSRLETVHFPVFQEGRLLQSPLGILICRNCEELNQPPFPPALPEGDTGHV